MTLSINRDPDHVQATVEGVMCINCGEFSPGVQEFCIGSPLPMTEGDDVEKFSGCGSSAVALVEPGTWLYGSQPSPAGVHDVEHDLSSGLVAYTQLTKEQIVAHAKARKAYLAEEQRIREVLEDKERRRELAREAVRKLAATDDSWKALAELLDVELDI